MNRRLRVVISLAVIFLFSLNMISVAFAYSYVTNVTTANDMLVTYDTIIDNGSYFFQFYVDSATSFIYYKSSSDGITWGGAQGATTIPVDNPTYPFAVYSKDDKVWLAYHNTNNIYIRNGSIIGDLVNWDSNQNIAAAGSPLFLGGFFETTNYIWFVGNILSAAFYRFSVWSTPINSDNGLWSLRINQQTVDTVNPGFLQQFRGAKIPFYTDGYMILSGQYTTNYYYRVYNFTTLTASGIIGTKVNAVSQVNAFDIEYFGNEVFFNYRYITDLNTYWTKFNASLVWSTPTFLYIGGNNYIPLLIRGNTVLYSLALKPDGLIVARNYTDNWSSLYNITDTPAISGTQSNKIKNANSTRLGYNVHASNANPHNIYFVVIAQDVPPIPPPPPPISGIIGGELNNTRVNIDGRISYIYVANVQKSIYINYTYANLINYSNTYASDVWITTSLYSTSNSNPISSVNPLVLIWQNTTLIHNGTTNTPIINYPRLNTKDAQYVAIALSATEDISINASSTTQSMYSYPVYAPYSIEYLNNETNRLGIYFLWGIKVPDSYQNFTKVTPEVRFDIVKGMNAMFISMAIPISLGWASTFFGVIVGMMIFLYKAKTGFDMDTAKLPIVFVGVLILGVISTFSLIGGLPFEELILAVLVSIGLYVGVILRLVMGGKKE